MGLLMLVIPVIDIRNGLVVRARGGDRDAYKPIETPLAKTSGLADVARGLIGLSAGLRTLYIADLDGIEGRGRDLEAVKALSAALPEVAMFVDDGSAGVAAVAVYRDNPRVKPVIGSETLKEAAALRTIAGAVPHGVALSLDWRGDEPLGPRELFEAPEIWPEDVIVMTLARVGSGLGPDIERLKAVKALAGSRRVYAAGGVRNVADLKALEGIAAGALVASALHDGAISSGELDKLV